MASFLQTTAGDIDLTGGKLTFVTGDPEKAQKIRNRLSLALGEWFLDTRLGVPYFQYILIKNPDLELIKRIFIQVISGVAGIRSVENVTITLDRASRVLTYSYIAVSDENTLINGGNSDQFIVSAQ